MSVLKGHRLLLACLQPHFCPHLYVCLSLRVQLNSLSQGWRQQVVPEHVCLSTKGNHIPGDCDLYRTIGSVLELACMNLRVSSSGEYFDKPNSCQLCAVELLQVQV